MYNPRLAIPHRSGNPITPHDHSITASMGMTCEAWTSILQTSHDDGGTTHTGRIDQQEIMWRFEQPHTTAVSSHAPEAEGLNERKIR